MAIAEWNITADGNSAAKNLDHRKPLQMVAQGTFDGATIIAQFSADGGTTWNAVTGVTFTGGGAVGRIFATLGHQVRLVTSGAGGSTDVQVQLTEVQ